MGRRFNELYIGDEYFRGIVEGLFDEDGNQIKEGREIKHVGLIKEFGNINVNKVSDKPLILEGWDIETNHLTAEMKLLGVWDGINYNRYYKENFVAIFFDLIDELFWKQQKTGQTHAIAYWNKLDPFVIFKQFLLLFSEQKQNYSMKRYGKIGGEWSKTEGKWLVRPVIEVTVKRGYRKFKFGIKNVIRSSLQFFYYESNGLFCIDSLC